MTADQVVATEDTVFSLEEVKEHTREEDCWLVIDGHVYDVTKFLDEHPGGFDIIIANTGQELALGSSVFFAEPLFWRLRLVRCRQGCL